jgi:hypothetical protein
METPYREPPSVVLCREDCACFRRRQRAAAAALLVLAVSFVVLAYELAQLTAAMSRQAEATRQAAVAALQRPAAAVDRPRPQEPATDSPSTAAPHLPPPPLRLVALCHDDTTACRAARVARVESGIVKIDDYYLLDHRVLDEILENQAELMHQTRVVTTAHDGESIIRLFGVSPGSVLYDLGFRNGDRLESINGFEVSNPERALEAYARLRSADSLEVRVIREGRVVRLHYELW